MRALPVLAVLCCGCGSSIAPDGAPGGDAASDAALDASSEANASSEVGSGPACATTFGSALTKAFGKLDGVVVAVVRHEDRQCADAPSENQLVVHVRSMGAVYRAVLTVASESGADVRFASLSRGGLSPWLEAWHAPAAMDYASMLGVHAGGTFAPVKRDALVANLVSAIPVGAKVSVYGTSSGGSTIQLVHKNTPDQDGALVVNADGGATRWLLFHFAEQTF